MPFIHTPRAKTDKSSIALTKKRIEGLKSLKADMEKILKFPGHSERRKIFFKDKIQKFNDTIEYNKKILEILEKQEKQQKFKEKNIILKKLLSSWANANRFLKIKKGHFQEKIS